MKLFHRAVNIPFTEIPEGLLGVTSCTLMLSTTPEPKIKARRMQRRVRTRKRTIKNQERSGLGLGSLMFANDSSSSSSFVSCGDLISTS